MAEEWVLSEYANGFAFLLAARIVRGKRKVRSIQIDRIDYNWKFGDSVEPYLGTRGEMRWRKHRVARQIKKSPAKVEMVGVIKDSEVYKILLFALPDYPQKGIGGYEIYFEPYEIGEFLERKCVSRRQALYAIHKAIDDGIFSKAFEFQRPDRYGFNHNFKLNFSALYEARAKFFDELKFEIKAVTIKDTKISPEVKSEPQNKVAEMASTVPLMKVKQMLIQRQCGASSIDIARNHDLPKAVVEYILYSPGIPQ